MSYRHTGRNAGQVAGVVVTVPAAVVGAVVVSVIVSVFSVPVTCVTENIVARPVVTGGETRFVVGCLPFSVDEITEHSVHGKKMCKCNVGIFICQI